MLSIIKYIETHGLEKAAEDFKLKTRDYGHKVLIKYDQIESDMKLEEVQDCRGLILEKGTWKIMCMSFRKFFNEAESNAAKIDWDTARILEKLDGSLIQLYYDWVKNEWFASTSGTGEGEGEVNNKMGTTFNQLFWQTLEKYPYFRKANLRMDCTYVFELTTPYNIVVKPHGESGVTLLTIRDNKNLEEFSFESVKQTSAVLGVPMVKSFGFEVTSIETIMKSLEGMPWHDEGYVVVDAFFNRIKIKNPAYVAVHHLKSKTAEHNILTIVKTNEIEEFAATFPERKDELLKLKDNYDKLLVQLKEAWGELEEFKPMDESPAERKKFALAVLDKCAKGNLKSFQGLFFGLGNGKVATVNEYMMEYDDKILYKML